MLTPLPAADLVFSPEGMSPEPLLLPILSDSNLALLYGPRGIGKSFLALGLAWAAASGREFLKWRAIKPRRVLYIDGELTGSDPQQRLAALGPPPQRLHLLAAGVPGSRLPVLRGDSDRERAWEPRMEDRYPELLIVDSLSSVVGDASHAAARWAEARRWLLRMRKIGIAVVLVHHGTRRGEPRGPSHREDVFDLVMSLRRPADYRPREGLRVELHFEKARGLCGPDLDPFEARMSTDRLSGRAHWDCRPTGSAELYRAAALLRQGMSAGEAVRTLGVSRAKFYRLRERAMRDGLVEAAPADE